MSGILHWLRIRAGAGEPFSKGIAKPVAPQPDEPVVLTAVESTQDVHNIVVCTLCSYVPTHLLPLATPHIPFKEACFPWHRAQELSQLSFAGAIQQSCWAPPRTGTAAAATAPVWCAAHKPFKWF